MTKRYSAENSCCNEYCADDCSMDESGIGNWVYYEDHEREVRELERRILWLETRMMNAYELECFGNDDCYSTIGMQLDFEPRNASNVNVRYMRPIAVKPTPEDFE